VYRDVYRASSGHSNPELRVISELHRDPGVSAIDLDKPTYVPDLSSMNELAIWRAFDDRRAIGEPTAFIRT
jgi:hypothetical protein